MTFLSDLRQPEVDLFAPLSHDFEQLFRQIVSMRVRTPSNTNLVASGLLKERMAHFRYTCVALKRRCLNSLLIADLGGPGVNLIKL